MSYSQGISRAKISYSVKDSHDVPPLPSALAASAADATSSSATKSNKQ